MPSDKPVPGWVNETPDETTKYQLIMWIDQAGEQELDLTRDEFIQLEVSRGALDFQKGRLTDPMASLIVTIVITFYDKRGR